MKTVCVLRRPLSFVSSVRARPIAPRSMLQMTRFNSAKPVPETSQARIRSRRFIRSYQAKVIVVFPPDETARGCLAGFAASPARTERFAAPDSSSLYPQTDKRARANLLRPRQKFAELIG